MGQKLSSKDAAVKGVQIRFRMGECAGNMGRSSNDAEVKDAQDKLKQEEYV